MLRRTLFLALALAALAWPRTVPGRYIVEFEEEASPGPQRLARVRARQADARKRLSALRQTRLRGSVERVGNLLLVEAPDAAELAKLPGVRRVHAVRTFKLHLDRAVSLQKIDEAWRAIGEDRAGAGVKVAVLDTGVDAQHPGLLARGLEMPAGFPKANRPEDEALATPKVIVARSYVDLLPFPDRDRSARDHVGHGTALAMIIAGGRATAPLAGANTTIAGVAPRAQIGNYRIFGTPPNNDQTTDDVIIKAIDDAVADGMDIINLSLGSDVAPRPEDDPLVQAVERAAQAGVIVVCSAGNNGPDFGTVGSPGTAPSAITVGSTGNTRFVGTSIQVDGMAAMRGRPGDGPAPSEPLRGPGFDVTEVDPSGLACEALPPGSLTGRVVLITRGTCTFNQKLENALRAGAIGAVVHTVPSNPALFTMSVTGATLPAMLIGPEEAARVRARLKAAAGAAITLSFRATVVEQPANRLSGFSSIGPSPDFALKPEMTAVGGNVLTATQQLDPNGDMYSASGFILISGTSFSAPTVAGAAALLKSARPGLTVEQYRSLLINTATAGDDVLGTTTAVAQQAGAGQLDAAAALRSPLAVSPSVISFGAGTADPRAKATLKLHNLSGTAETYSFQLVPRGDSAGPALPASATAGAGDSAVIELPLESSALRPGAHEGRIRVIAASGATIEVPYWYAVRSSEAASFPVLLLDEGATAGTLRRDAVLFRVVDAAGVPIADARPEVTVRQGGGSVVSLTDYSSGSPGLWGVNLRLGPEAGANVFRLEYGGKFRDVAIPGN